MDCPRRLSQVPCGRVQNKVRSRNVRLYSILYCVMNIVYMDKRITNKWIKFKQLNWTTTVLVFDILDKVPHGSEVR